MIDVKSFASAAGLNMLLNQIKDVAILPGIAKLYDNQRIRLAILGIWLNCLRGAAFKVFIINELISHC